MHLLLVVFSLAGGLMLFGPSGLVLGPLVAALFVTFLEIYKIEFEEQLVTEDQATPALTTQEEKAATPSV
jgi:predicted PurR-regulated permease PerM